MNSLKFIVIAMLLFLVTSAQSQVSVSVNIGSPPAWGPSGYSGVQYYYLPDVEAYYDVRASMFIYYEGGSWVHRGYLPARYGNYDLYGGYKVVMSDYHGNAPYSHFNEHRKMYAKGYRGKPQRNIGERPNKGNQGNQVSHNDHHDNKVIEHGNNKGGDHGNNKNAGHGNEKNAGHGNEKNVKNENSHEKHDGIGECNCSEE